MLNIKLIVIGKLKENYLKQASEEYLKRLSRFARVTVTELPEERLAENASKKEEERVKEAEAQKILSRLRENDFVILLTPDGKMMSSEDFARYIEDRALAGTSSLSFCIGGSLGHGEGLKKRADLEISFGRMTFPHQLFRVLLLEQIYRACKINANEAYHK